MQILSLCLAFAFINAIYGFGLKHDWTYELNDIKCESSDKEKFDADLKIERQGRDEFTISGTVNIKVPLDDTTFVEVTFERSATGSSDYISTPFKVQKGTITGTMNGAYAKFVMPSVKDCAPLAPQFDKFAAPLEPKLIELNKCLLSLDVFPHHMQGGFYRVTIILSGAVDATIQVYLEIIPALA